MKSVKFALLVLILCIGFSSCIDLSEFEKIADVVITDCYVNDLGHKVFVMSDGGMAEIVITENGSHHIQFYDKNYESLSKVSKYEVQIFNKWLNTEVGSHVVLMKSQQRDDIVYYYDIVIAPDFSAKRKVIRVTKYDGNLNKIDGNFHLKGGLLSGSSGTGELKGEGMGSQNMFINIYFEDRAPITVNAKENQLWLDVEAGSIVLEKRVNGRTSFTPVF